MPVPCISVHTTVGENASAKDVRRFRVVTMSREMLAYHGPRVWI